MTKQPSKTKIQQPQNRVEKEYHRNGGVNILRDHTGQKVVVQRAKKGENHGASLGWWDGGQKWWVDTWRNGKQHGMSTGWYENGQKNWENYHLCDIEYASINWDEKGDVTEVNFPIHKQQTKNHPKTPK